MRGALRLAGSAPCYQAVPASPTQVHRIVENTHLSLDLRLMILIAWKSASRLYDVGLLRPCDVQKVTDVHFAITFSKAKGDPFQGCRVITIHLGPAASMFHQFWTRHCHRQFLFTTPLAEIYRILKSHGLSNHSLRRGALHYLNGQGFPLDALQLFARHQNPSTTRLYLGARPSREQRQQVVMSELL